MRLLVAFLVCLVSLTTTVHAQDVSANPTRPSASDNAFLTARGYAEIETGWAATASIWSVPTLLKLSALDQIEFGVTAYGALQQPKGGSVVFGTPGAQVKYQFSRRSWGAVASVIHVDWPSDGPPVYTLYPVVSLPGDAVSIDATLGGSFVNRTSTGFYALAVSPSLHEALGFYAEIYGSFSSGAPVHAVDAGISYPLSPRFVIDLAIGTALTDNADDWMVQVGLTTTLAKVFR